MEKGEPAVVLWKSGQGSIAVIRGLMVEACNEMPEFAQSHMLFVLVNFVCAIRIEKNI